jgi:hypothetical protein
VIGMKKIEYKPAPPWPPETPTLSPILQMLIGFGIGIALLSVAIVFARARVPLDTPWWIACFICIWILVFLGMRKKWYAMVLVTLIVVFVGAGAIKLLLAV